MSVRSLTFMEFSSESNLTQISEIAQINIPMIEFVNWMGHQY